MAAGSQLENGIWALLVMAARERQIAESGVMVVGVCEQGTSQWP